MSYGDVFILTLVVVMIMRQLYPEIKSNEISLCEYAVLAPQFN